MFKQGTYFYFLDGAAQHLGSQYHLAHVFGHSFLPIQEAFLQAILFNLFGPSKVQEYLQQSIFLLIFLNNRLQI